MSNKKEAYLCVSAMLRAREPKLLTMEKAERMLDAASYEDAAKILTDCVGKCCKASSSATLETLRRLDRKSSSTRATECLHRRNLLRILRANIVRLHVRLLDLEATSLRCFSERTSIFFLLIQVAVDLPLTMLTLGMAVLLDSSVWWAALSLSPLVR